MYRDLDDRLAEVERCIRDAQDQLASRHTDPEEAAYLREEIHWLIHALGCDQYMIATAHVPVRELWQSRGVGTAKEYGLREGEGWSLSDGRGSAIAYDGPTEDVHALELLELK